MGELQFVFVHGLSGWGSYDESYARMPYWGMRGGDLMAFLREEGYACYAASVAPSGSAWDRACELYAQIAGTRVDYGKAHSARYGHERLGRDFTGRALQPDPGNSLPALPVTGLSTQRERLCLPLFFFGRPRCVFLPEGKTKEASL